MVPKEQVADYSEELVISHLQYRIVRHAGKLQCEFKTVFALYTYTGAYI